MYRLDSEVRERVPEGEKGRRAGSRGENSLLILSGDKVPRFHHP